MSLFALCPAITCHNATSPPIVHPVSQMGMKSNKNIFFGDDNANLTEADIVILCRLFASFLTYNIIIMPKATLGDTLGKNREWSQDKSSDY